LVFKDKIKNHVGGQEGKEKYRRNKKFPPPHLKSSPLRGEGRVRGQFNQINGKDCDKACLNKDRFYYCRVIGEGSGNKGDEG